MTQEDCLGCCAEDRPQGAKAERGHGQKTALVCRPAKDSGGQNQGGCGAGREKSSRVRQADPRHPSEGTGVGSEKRTCGQRETKRRTPYDTRSGSLDMGQLPRVNTSLLSATMCKGGKGPGYGPEKCGPQSRGPGRALPQGRATGEEAAEPHMLREETQRADPRHKTGNERLRTWGREWQTLRRELKSKLK